MKVTKEEVDKAKAAALSADGDAAEVAKAAKTGAAFYSTYEAACTYAEAAWDKYLKLKWEYENGIKSTED